MYLALQCSLYLLTTVSLMLLSMFPCECSQTFICFRTGDEVSQADVDKLREEVKEYVLASHLHWVLWGLLSVSDHHIQSIFPLTSMVLSHVFFKEDLTIFSQIPPSQLHISTESSALEKRISYRRIILLVLFSVCWRLVFTLVGCDFCDRRNFKMWSSTSWVTQNNGSRCTKSWRDNLKAEKITTESEWEVQLSESR